MLCSKRGAHLCWCMLYAAEDFPEQAPVPCFAQCMVHIFAGACFMLQRLFLNRLVCHALLNASCISLQVHQLVEEADVVREGWNGYNVFHDTASRVAALDVGFLPSARASSAPPAKFVYLLGSDDFQEEDIPRDAFVVYQVCKHSSGCLRCLPGV